MNQKSKDVCFSFSYVFIFFLGTISSALISQARLPKGQTGVSDLIL